MQKKGFDKNQSNSSKERGKGPRKTKQVKFYGKENSQREFENKELEEVTNAFEEFDPSKAEKLTDFPLSRKTQLGLKKGEYIVPTDIQRSSLGLSLKGCDILGASKTGSGKTLAFLIPVLEKLYHERWTYLDGLGALVITPTRELAYQIFEVLKIVGSYHDFSAGLIIGGKDLRFERERMDKCHIIICTPGRILQHMDENPLFDCANLKILVLDEADRILDLGFQKTMNAIIENLPPERQTLLFSATQTRSVKDLARLSLKDPKYISVHENAKYSTPEALQQSYMVCELHEKMDLLWSFIRSHRKQKILVFLSSCKQVKYTYEVFCRMRPGLSVLALYGTLHQLRRMAIYDDFCKKQTAVMFATDIASRGLDFPSVHWVVHLDCPEDVNTYIHRAGRTARYEENGESLLILLPSEEKAMTQQLEGRKIPLNKISVNQLKYISVTRKMEALCARDVKLKESAQRAFVAYLKSVFLMKDKSVFAIQSLDIDAYSRSLGLAVSPRVRFLQRHLRGLDDKQKEQIVDVHSQKNNSNFKDNDNDEVKLFRSAPSPFQSSSMENGDSSEEENDFLTVKRTIMPTDTSQHSEEEDSEVEINMSREKPRVISKASVAKKILKKNIKANKKTVFNEEGEELESFPTEQRSEVAKKLLKEAEVNEFSGLDLNIAKQIMEEEDKIDKKLFRKRVAALHKERKRKWRAQKEESDEEFPKFGASDDEREEMGAFDEERKFKRHRRNEDEKESEDEVLSAYIAELPDPDKLKDMGEKKLKSRDSKKKNSIKKKKKLNKDKIKTRPEETELSIQADEELAMHILSLGK